MCPIDAVRARTCAATLNPEGGGVMGAAREPARARAEVLARGWAEYRPAVFGVAYRLLGTVTDAEDVTQDVWLRASAARTDDIRDLRAWLVTVAARLSYDILKSARVRRELCVGPRLPEPLVTGPDASDAVIVDESVSTAMLLVMAELSPPERVAFVLHDVFGLGFGGIATVLSVSVVSARQHASRARRRLAAARESSPPASPGQRARLLATFKAAYETGNLGDLVTLLHPEIVRVTDGGDSASAARQAIVGDARVACRGSGGAAVATRPHRARRARRARPGRRRLGQVASSTRRG